jgi:hypothetical protein
MRAEQGQRPERNEEGPSVVGAFLGSQGQPLKHYVEGPSGGTTTIGGPPTRERWGVLWRAAAHSPMHGLVYLLDSW